jgi:small subunit ribosomal protein S6
MKRRYELTVILSPELSSTDTKKITTSIADLIKKHKGKLVKEDDWGVRELSYSIKKHAQGAFRFYLVEIDGGALKALSQSFFLTEDLLRFLIVKAGD